MKRKAVFFMGRSGIYPFMSRVRHIQSKLDNSLFSIMTPTPAEVMAKMDELKVFQDEIARRDRGRLGQRNEVRKAIERMVSKQCAFVNAIADGDLSVLEVSGFELNKVRGKRPLPTVGSTPNTTPLGNGEVIIEATGIQNHDFVELQVNGPGGSSYHYSGLYAKFEINNLPVGVVLKARMRGINCHGEGEWTGSVTFIVHGSAQHGNNN